MDSTHKTCKSIVKPTSDSYLFSIVAKNDVTGQGYPLAYMITDKEDSEHLQIWLRWLRDCIHYIPDRIMIDCSPVEINSIRQVYGNYIQVLLCHWYIKRAGSKILNQR